MSIHCPYNSCKYFLKRSKQTKRIKQSLKLYCCAACLKKSVLLAEKVVSQNCQGKSVGKGNRISPNRQEIEHSHVAFSFREDAEAPQGISRHWKQIKKSLQLVISRGKLLCFCQPTFESWSILSGSRELFFFSFFYTVSPLEPFFKFHFPVKSGGWMYQFANRATMAVRTNCLGWFLAATFKLEVPRGLLLVVFVPGTRVICKKFTFSRETSPLLHRNCFRSMFDF